MINTGCVLFKEGKYEDALKYFSKAQQLTGFNASTIEKTDKSSNSFLSLFCFCLEVSYNIALCYYELKQYAQAVQYLGGIVEKGIKEYPG